MEGRFVYTFELPREFIRGYACDFKPEGHFYACNFRLQGHWYRGCLRSRRMITLFFPHDEVLGQWPAEAEVVYDIAASFAARRGLHMTGSPSYAGIQDGGVGPIF